MEKTYTVNLELGDIEKLDTELSALIEKANLLKDVLTEASFLMNSLLDI